MPNRSQTARTAWNKRKSSPAYLAEQEERKDLVAQAKLLGVSRRWADLSIYDLRRLVAQTETKKLLYPQAVQLGWLKHERQSTTEALDLFVKKARKTRQQKAARQAKPALAAHRAKLDQEFNDRLVDYESIPLPPPASTHYDVIVRKTTTKPCIGRRFTKKSYELRPLPVTEATFPTIVAFVRGKLNMAVSRRSSPDSEVIARMRFYTSNPNSADFDDTQQLSRFVKASRYLSVAQVERQIVRLLNEHFSNDDYICFFFQLEVLEQAAGGCSGKKPGTCEYSLYQTGDGFKIKPHSVKSTNNNCALLAFTYEFGLKGNAVQADKVRRELGIPLGRPIALEDLPSILDWYNAREGKGLGLCVKHGVEDVLFIKAKNDKPEIDWNDYVKIYLHDGHYTTYTIELTPEAKTCPDCGKVYKHRHDKCDVQGAAFRQYRLSSDKDARNLIRVRKLHDQDELDEDGLVFFKVDSHKVGSTQRVLSVSLLHNDQLYIYSGPDAMADATDFLLSLQGKTVVGYSTSHQRELGHLLNELTRRPDPIKRLLMPQDKLLELLFGDKMRVYDLNNYVGEALPQAARSFRLENQVEGTSSNDVYVVRELFRAVNGLIHGLVGQNITGCLSLYQQAYEIWTQKDVIASGLIVERPSLDKHERFILPAIFGARCYPLRREWTSNLYDQCKAGMVSYEQLQASDEHMFYADSSSHYPACMAGCSVMPVRFPIGLSRVSADPEKEFREGKLGFYNIHFVPPKNLRHPVLPRKVNSFLRWTLEPGQGTYTSVDIQNALDAGYQVQFIGECLVWDKSGEVFNNYVQFFYDLKRTAEETGNPVLRSMAKRFLNSLYGKMLQGIIETQSEIVQTPKEYDDFAKRFYLQNFSITESDKLLLTGRTLNREATLKKPTQYGAFVLAYSRRLNLTYLRTVDPTLQSIIYSYGDTDSLRLTAESYRILLKAGQICSKSEARLGLLTNDLPDDALIIREVNLAPKTYLVDYMDRFGQVHSKGICKGIPKSELTPDFFDGDSHTVQFRSVQQRRFALSKADESQGISHFDILDTSLSRTMNPTAYSGMTLVSNDYLPLGYSVEP
jgi:hypothetical protein